MQEMRDPNAHTTDSMAIAFDVVNLSKTVTLIFSDFSTERARIRQQGRSGFGQPMGLPENFPPAEIQIPPQYMATIPDEWYRGKTKGGETTADVYHLKGDARPLRRTRRRFAGGGKIYVESLAPIGWRAVPVNDRARAEVEAARAKGGR